ncbi:MAG: Cof-type HAD-IIB family hydrolase [Paraprevotella sp.]|nr:Cof-type HAD-IIB family hydrolase [Paraprevotella sp.]
MKNVKAVFFDIDGTLVSFQTHRIPQSTLDAVAALRSRGIKVYIATGRPSAFIDNLGSLEYDGMITVTGAHCFTREGKVIYHHPVPAADVERVIAYTGRDTEAYPVIFVCENEMFVTKIDDDVNEVARLLNLKMPAGRPSAHAEGKDVSQLISLFKADREPELMSTLMPGCLSTRWHPLFTDVIAKGVDKSVGIDRVLAYEGIRLDEVMAFGDGGNDMAMLSHVPCGVAMGNGCEELKKVATYVTDSVDDDGVAKALRHFRLID